MRYSRGIRYKIRCVIPALLALLLLFGACDGGKQGPYDFGDDTGTGAYLTQPDGTSVKLEVLPDITQYAVVRGDLGSDAEKEATRVLYETLQKNLGVALTLTTDWIGPIQQESTYEILVGKTERPASVTALTGLGINDYVIRRIGTKLVIAGGSDEATQAAVDFFLANCVDIYRSEVRVPTGEGYVYRQTYLFDSVSIDGVDLGEYSLYATDPTLDLTPVQTCLSKQVTGTKCEIAETMQEKHHYIIFDNAFSLVSEYGVRLEASGDLYVYGSYDTFDRAVAFFTGEFFEALTSTGKRLNLQVTNNVSRHADIPTLYTKEQLLALLQDVGENPDEVIFGERVGGSQRLPSDTIGTFREATGEAPAVLGLDLGLYGLDLATLSDAEQNRVICELVSYAAGGGIISLTCRYTNPTDNWPVGDKSGGSIGGTQAAADLVTDGTPINRTFRAELDRAADFLALLAQNGVPVLWRPLDESEGAMPWYGAETLGTAAQARLWRYIQTYFEGKGLTNLLWEAAPTQAAAYPTGATVDVVGVGLTLGDEPVTATYTRAAEALAGAPALPVAVTQLCLTHVAATRDEQAALYNARDLLDDLQGLRGEGISLAYCLTRQGTSSLAWLGEGEAFVADAMILTQKDIAERLWP